MRRERWWWLLVTLVVSFLIHAIIGWKSQRLDVAFVPPARPELEVTLEPLPKEKALPKRPEPKRREPPQVAKSPPERRPRVRPTREVRAPRRAAPVRTDRTIPVRAAKIAEVRPEAPQVNPGGVRTARIDKPMPLGMITPRPTPTPQPSTPDETPETAAPTRVAVSPRVRTDDSALAMPNPLATKATDEAPQITPQKSTPHIMRMAKADRSLAGGGTPSPSEVLGGHDGARGPETPPDDLLFNGGGAGGAKLPKIAPRIGGGGGNPILSVPNPLASEAVPDEKPGLGAGHAGGEGLGAGGGAGYGRGHGVGTNANGKGLLSSLRQKPGIGLGASRGSGRGTFKPGGGHGTGAELPGTGGAGFGYGRGSGLGVGNGFRPGVGAGSGLGGHGSGGGGANVGSGVRMASNRGVPFGDITGLLRGGDPNGGGGTGGGPGGSGRGAGAGGRSGGSGTLHVVYLLDVSGSMRYNDKIGKARVAMAKALSELRRTDWFNIICFDKSTYPFASTMQKATPNNVQKAIDYINAIELDRDPGTNMSGVLEQALSLQRVSEIFLMSDGLPRGGIEDFSQLRADVRNHNGEKVPIYTLALGVGTRFKGIELMRGMADDNGGKFNYINLRGEKPMASDRQGPDHS